MMNNLTEKVREATLNSMEVAEMVSKRHADLIRDIETYSQYLENARLRSQDFFFESTYKADGNNKTYKCYDITKKGCEFVAHKLTGQKGAIFTATYINRFHEMGNQVSPPRSIEDIIILQLEEQKKIKNRVDNLENNMPLFNIECKELQAVVRKRGVETLGGYKSPAYRDNSIRGKIYSDIQRQLKREFGVCRYEAIKRIQLTIAREIVESYRAPMVLVNEIQLSNSQVIM